MKTASVNEIKTELKTLAAKELMDLCLRLVKFKKENKELLNFLLFEAHHESGYVDSVKLEMDEMFKELPNANWFLTKKSLRKILRTITRYSKYTNKPESEVDLRIHFCTRMKAMNIPYRSQQSLQNMYDQQIKKLHKQVAQLHEDLQFDYLRQLEQL